MIRPRTRANKALDRSRRRISHGFFECYAAARSAWSFRSVRSEGKIGFRYYGISIGSKSEAGNKTPKEEETMTAEKCPRGWDAARVQRVLEYYESQTDEE